MEILKHFAWCAVCALAAFVVGKSCGKNESDCEATSYADTVRICDTLVVVKPLPVERRKGVNRIERVALAQVSETVAIANSAVQRDSVDAIIPVDTFIFSRPDFRAVVSGFALSLDSIQIYRTEKIVTRHLKPKRWAVSCGVGLNVGRGGVNPGLYVGVGYVLHSF